MEAAFTVFALLGIPLWLSAWAIYVWRRWRRRWRYVAALPVLVIILDVLIVAVAGGYGAGTILGLHMGAFLFMCVLSGLHRAWMIQSRLPGPRRRE